MSDKQSIAHDHPREVFCQKLVRGFSQADAYREAYPNSKNWQDASVHNKASALARSARVQARLAEIKAPIIKDLQVNVAGYGLKQAMDEAEQAMNLARDTRQPGAMVAAVQLRAKLNALLIDRKEVAVTKLDGFDPGEKLMMLDQLQTALAERKRLQPPDQPIDDVEAK
jgi:hypothetical protein